MRTKLEDSGYYGVSEEEWYNESDYESDTSTQILSGTDNESDAEADSNDEGDEYYEDNSAYEWNSDDEHWDYVGHDDEPVDTSSVVTRPP